jgi:putative ABC transport system permease protein
MEWWRTRFSQRRREIGLRMALGARRRAVVIVVIGDGFRSVGVGTAGGIGMTMTVARGLGGLIAGAGDWNWWVLGAAAIVMLGAGLAACLIPAWDSARMDPSVALRE